MTAITHAQRVKEVADAIGGWPNPTEDMAALLGGIAVFLTAQYGPRVAAEILYIFADECATLAPQEWRL